MKKNALLMVLIAAVGCMSLQAQEMEMVMAEEQMAAPADPEVAQEIEGKLARFKRVMRCLRKKDGCTAEEISQAYKIVTGIIGTVAVLGTGIGLGVKKYGMPRLRQRAAMKRLEEVFAKYQVPDSIKETIRKFAFAKNTQSEQVYEELMTGINALPAKDRKNAYQALYYFLTKESSEQVDKKKISNLAAGYIGLPLS